MLSSSLDNAYIQNKVKDRAVIFANNRNPNPLKIELERLRQQNIEKCYILYTICPLPDNEVFYRAGCSPFPLTMMQVCTFPGEAGTAYPKELEQKQATEIAAKKALKHQEFYKQVSVYKLGEFYSVNHVVCMMVDFQAKQVSYKDSYGNPMPAELKTLFNEVLSIPIVKMISDSTVQQNINDHCNCKFLTLENLQRFIDQKPFVDLSENYIAKMEAIRNKYAEEVRPALEAFFRKQQELEEKCAPSKLKAR